MSLSQAEVEQIAEAISSRMAHKFCGHDEHCNLLFDRLRAHGDGNIEKGIESFGKSIAFVRSIRQWGEKAGGEIAMALLKVVVFTVLTAAGIGFWVKYGK